jgi:hypothetical protein
MQSYIRHIYDDDRSIMIILFLKEQAELLLSQTSFEVDMSFKRIRQQEINEIILANFLSNDGKSISNMFKIDLKHISNMF